MPQIVDKPLDSFVQSPQPDSPVAEPERPSWSDMAGAAMRQENDIYNAAQLFMAQKEKPEPNFNIVEKAKERNVNPEDYLDVFSTAELDRRIAKVQKEQKDREILAASGWTGIAAMVASGAVSPTSFIPFVRAATGVKSVLLGATAIASGVAAQEAVLLANQETRTAGEAAFSIGASAVLGGVLGAISHTLSKDVIDKMAYDMANDPGQLAVSPPPPLHGESTVGARNTPYGPVDAGGLKNGWGARTFSYLSPITRGLQQWNAPKYIRDAGGSSEVRRITGGLSQGHLVLDENKNFIPASAGGNVEDLRRTYAAVSYGGSKDIENGYIEYVLGKSSGVMKLTRAKVAGGFDPNKMTYDEFKRAVTLDIWSNFSRQVDPAVRKVAKSIDEKVYKKLYDEGVEVGIFTGNEKTVGDENYANRVYNHEVIMRRHEEFVKILADNYRGQLEADYAKKLADLRGRMAKDKQQLEDMSLPIDEAKAKQQEFKQELTDLDTNAPDGVISAADAIRANKSAIKKAQDELTQLRSMKLASRNPANYIDHQSKIDQLEAFIKSKLAENEDIPKKFLSTDGTNELEKYLKAKAEIRRRLYNLGRAHALVDERLGKKYLALEKNDERMVATILRAHKQLQKFSDFLAKGSNKEIEKELKRLKGLFHKEGETLDKLDEKLRKLMEEDAPPPPKDEGTPPPPNEPAPPGPTEPPTPEGHVPLEGEVLPPGDVLIGGIPKENPQEIVDEIFEVIDDIEATYELPLPAEKANPQNFRLHSNLTVASTYFRTGDHVLDWLELHGPKEYQVLARRLRGTIDNMSFHVYDPKTAVKLDGLVADMARTGNINDSNALYYQVRSGTFGRKDKPKRGLIMLPGGVGNVDTLMHEMIHAAVNTRIYYGLANPNSRLGRLVGELDDIRKALTKDILNKVQENKVRHYQKNPDLHKIPYHAGISADSLYEMATYALTNLKVREYMRSIPYKGKTVLSRFLTLMRNILGIKPEEESIFTAVLDNFDRMLKVENPSPGVPYAFEPTPRLEVDEQGATITPWKTIIIDKIEPTAQTAGQATIDDLTSGTPSVDGRPPEMKLSDRMDKIAERMDKLAADIEKLDTFDRVAWRQEVEQMMKDLAETHVRINEKRALRNEKLWKQIENLSPEKQAAIRAKLETRAKERPIEFRAKMLEKGAQGIDITRGPGGEVTDLGAADFADHADKLARETVGKILGVHRRLAYSDIIQAERGPELARVLNIPSEKIKDFLETDIEKLIAIYTRTVGSDISIARVFGSPDMAETFKKLEEEKQQFLQQIDSLKGKDGKPLSQAEKEKLQQETHAFYTDARKDLEVLLERAKGVRGIPRDPDSWSARAAKTAMELNFLRLMGGVVINSISDPARVVMKYGLTNTFKHGFLPMIRAFKTFRMSMREAKLAGTALDMVLHTRLYSFNDIFDTSLRGTIAERGISVLAHHMGVFALFDQWNTAVKEFTAGVANGKLLDSIAIVNGEKASAKELQAAQEFLAKNNIDEELARIIWQEVTNGTGGEKVNGVWLPNTENWNVANPDVARARRAYRAALGGEIDSTIITPGFERPNWIDSSLPARLIGQFKSFGLSTVQLTIMAGLQQHDMAFLNGMMISLALGALSYYLYAMAAGGETQQKMEDASIGHWADEAIARSGLTGIFNDAQQVAQRIPLLRQYASFGGQQTTRRQGGDLIEQLAGPTFSMMEKAFGIVQGVDEPTKHTLHLARQLLPFQNITYLRQLLDKVEEFAGSGLPEKRSGK